MAKRYIPVEEKSYRLHFTILGLMMFDVSAWAVWDETYTRRPWKQYEVDANRLEIAQAAAERDKAAADLQKPPLKPKLDALQKELETEEARLRDPQVRAQIEEANKKLVALTVERKKTAEKLTFAKSEADEANYWYSKALISAKKAKDPAEAASLEEEAKERKAELDARDARAAEAAKTSDTA